MTQDLQIREIQISTKSLYAKLEVLTPLMGGVGLTGFRGFSAYSPHFGCSIWNTEEKGGAEILADTQVVCLTSRLL